MKLPILFALCLPQVAPLHAQTAPPPAADSELVRVPFRNDMGLILLELHVGEGDPLTFLLDSGASGMVIDRAVAWIDCAVEDVYTMGDHYFVLGRVGALDADANHDGYLSGDEIHRFLRSRSDTAALVLKLVHNIGAFKE